MNHAYGKANPRLGIAALHALNIALWKWDTCGELPQEDAPALALIAQVYTKMGTLIHAPICDGKSSLSLDEPSTTAFTSCNHFLGDKPSSGDSRFSMSGIEDEFARLRREMPEELARGGNTLRTGYVRRRDTLKAAPQKAGDTFYL